MLWVADVDTPTLDKLAAQGVCYDAVFSHSGVCAPLHMHGRAFLGEHVAPRRGYMYDRIDTVRDRYRGIRDKRFKYIRNYEPWKPYVQPLAYRA